MTFKQLCIKSFLPLFWAGILFPFAKEIALTGDGINYLVVWIICGLPYAFSKIVKVIKTPELTGKDKALFSLLRLLTNCFTGGFKFMWSVVKGFSFLFAYIFSTFIAPLVVKKIEKKMEDVADDKTGANGDYVTVVSNDNTQVFTENHDTSTETVTGEVEVEEIAADDIYVEPTPTTTHKDMDKDIIYMGDVEYKEISTD